MSVAVTVKAKNRGVLFARVYLDSTLAKLKDLDESSLFETLSEWFTKADKNSLGNYVSSFVGPVLDVQGFMKSELSANCIALFEDRNHAKIISLCYVVDSHESLDQTVKGKNYAVSLIKALKKAGLRWGILTNGSIWRLYYAKEKAVFETFFQIDLREVIEDSDKLEVALFSHFFNVQSFMLDDEGKCPLDKFRQESEEATREIEEHLQSKMEDILGKICMGFIQSEGKKSHSEEERRTIFNNSIYLLYRLLFILFAEARGFLPIQNPEYYEKSAAKLMEIVRKNMLKGVENPEERTLWNTLSEVFNWVNQGNHALGIPPYNGGLFDNNEKPFLANHTIKNSYLSEALFSLGFRLKKDEIIPISYDDLSVRHLGSLYEGILEYQLFIAPERMVRRKQGNVYKFIPEQIAGKVTRQDTVIEKGAIYFSESSGERKLTGSYYTPEHVVRYIVENSLKQYIDRIDLGLKEQISKMIEAQRVAVDEEEKRRIERFVDTEILSFLEKEVLSINVLDPAMGSGHFLVNVAYYLANFIVEALCSTNWTNESINASPLWWRRKVVEKCIFGVDISELATELTKLSLWLTTADNRKPLTFLDHHIKMGNSLLGASLDNLAKLTGEKNHSKSFQTNLSFSIFKKEFVPKVLEIFAKMEGASENIGDIEMKKSKFLELESLKRSLKYVADTWLATFFGYHIDEGEYEKILNKAMNGEEVLNNKKVWEIASLPNNRFFHWWLEFPELFWTDSKNTEEKGFEIVLGNPPYIENRMLSQEEVDFFHQNFESAGGRLNTFAMFVEQSLNLLKNGGYLGFIIHRNSIKSNYYEGFRKFVLNSACIKEIVDLGSGVFKDVTGEMVILILEKENDAEKREKNKVEIITDIQDIENKVLNHKTNQSFFAELPNYLFNVSITTDDISVLERIKKRAIPLCQICKTKQGIIVGDEKRYITNNQESSIYKKVLRGRDVGRYSLNWGGAYVCYDKKTLIRAREQSIFECDQKILTQHVSGKIVATIDYEKCYALQTINIILMKEGASSLIKYVLALLNSRVLNFYYDKYFNMGSDFTTAVSTENLDKLPIHEVNLSDAKEKAAYDDIITHVDHLLDLNRRVKNQAGKNTDEIARIEDEMIKIDATIDELVYSIYGLTDSEREIIEKNQIKN